MRWGILLVAIGIACYIIHAVLLNHSLRKHVPEVLAHDPGVPFATTTPCVSCTRSHPSMGDAAGASCSPVGASWDRAHCRLVPRQRAALGLLWGVRTCDRLRL
jgi:hypothetical protein